MAVRFISDGFNFNFDKYKMYSVFLSIVLVALSLGLVVVKGVNFGIDFTGGLIVECKTEGDVQVESLHNAFDKTGVQGVSIQVLDGSKDLVLRLRVGSEEQPVVIGKVKSVLMQQFGDSVTYRKVDYVGPSIGFKKVIEGICAVVFALMGMFFYLWFRFNWKFGFGGVLALMHDTVITLGLISLLSIEFNLSSTAAILTIIGYSVNDSVVIFDRIREYLRKKKSKKISDIIGHSINSTLSRTILTSTTTVLATLPLVIFCDGTVRDFSLIVFWGIIVGTYSSIFVATSVILQLDSGSQQAL